MSETPNLDDLLDLSKGILAPVGFVARPDRESALAAANSRVGAPVYDALLTPPAPADSHVVLTEKSPMHRVALGGANGGAVTFSLKMNDPDSAEPVLLGALWELEDERTGAIQSYGKAMSAPKKTEKKNAVLYVDGDNEFSLDAARASSLRRLAIYTYAMSGIPRWQQPPVLEITFPDGGSITMKANPLLPMTRICVLASVYRVGDSFMVVREMEELRGQQSAVCTAYDYDIAWSAKKKEESR